MPDELLLFGENDFETSINAIFDVAKANKPEQIALFVKRLGIASIRKLYRWTSDQLQAGTGADIEWKKGKEAKFKLYIQVSQLENLRTVIDQTSDEKEEILEPTGELVGLAVTMQLE